MLTKLKLKQGEGELANFNPEIGKRRAFPQIMASKQNLSKFDVEAFSSQELQSTLAINSLGDLRGTCRPHS